MLSNTCLKCNGEIAEDRLYCDKCINTNNSKSTE